MPWVVRDVVDDINHAARCCTTRRWTRCPRRSGAGWATGRSGPAGRCARRPSCA